jgi:U3 small nucleolar RNA-associated protein 3
MGKKRKATSGASQPKGPRELNAKDARLGPITTYEDIADDQEKYWQDQDAIMFDQAPKSKKQRRQEEEEEFLEDSEEEVLAYDDQDSEDDEDDEELQELEARAKKFAKKQKRDAGDSSSEQGDEEEKDDGWWGSSRKEYYNADEIQTEQDALEEEQEARKLQKKRLAKMTDEDFIFNEDEWLADKPDNADDNEIVTEVLKDMEISEDMTPEDRLRILQSRYPELEYMAEELLELQPLLVTLQSEAAGQPSRSVAVVKYRILGCYVATLAMYFATLTSPARDQEGSNKALDPAELRDHEVMATLLECREAWQRVKDLKPAKPAEPAASIPSPPEEADMSDDETFGDALESSKKGKKATNKEKRKSKQAERQAKELEESLADLSALVKPTKKSKKKAKADTASDDNSDFGEEETMDSRAAAEKAARKKSLRFYTSQIVQKANKRAGAGRDAGGDMDIPYRERLKDRQARLNAEAEKRGLKSSKAGAELGDDSDDDDKKAANEMRDDEDEYYDLVAARSSQKKAGKAARAEALAAASQADRVVEQEVIGEDGKRKIT